MRYKVILGIILIALFGYFVVNFFDKTEVKTEAPKEAVQDDSSAQIIKTIPDPLDNTIIPADQIIEITFNKPLQNAPEFKVKIEPKLEYKVELSSDRKTAKITPIKPYNLGSSYTLYIGPDTKFDGVGNWNMDKTFHFQTVKYRGI